MTKIYIVKSSEGEYEDYHVWNEKAFTKREDAEAYAKQLDKEHNYRPQFITDAFLSTLRDCEYELPDWEEFPEEKITPENKNRWLKWQEEQEEKQIQLLINLMYQKGQFMTRDMYEQYEEWENNSYTNWYDCSIEELELV